MCLLGFFVSVTKDILRCRCDYGLPQFTEAKILQEYIKTDAYKMETQVKPPMAVTNAVSWRTDGIKYKKNEVRHGMGWFELTTEGPS